MRGKPTKARLKREQLFADWLITNLVVDLVRGVPNGRVYDY